MKKLSVGSMVLCSILLAGCNQDREPTAKGPQPEHQRAKTDDETIDYLIAMLHREDSTKKNGMAARNLATFGVKAERALPDLKKVAQEHPDSGVKLDAEAAVLVIEAAMEAAP